eukprot:SAG31_NODE_1529_length_8001_cov_13.491268_1_plen_250_part_00
MSRLARNRSPSPSPRRQSRGNGDRAIAIVGHRLSVRAERENTDCSDEELRKLCQRSLLRVEAETAIGSCAALSAGFSMSFVIENVNSSMMQQPCEPKCDIAEKILIFLDIGQLLCFLLVAALNLYTVLFTTGVGFTGRRILSKMSLSSQEIQNLFASFWDKYSTQRRAARDCFFVAQPIFFFSIMMRVGMRAWMHDAITSTVVIVLASISAIPVVAGCYFAMAVLGEIQPSNRYLWFFEDSGMESPNSR